MHESVVLPPQQDVTEIAEVPAVSDNAVIARDRSGEDARLHRARDGGEHCVEGCAESSSRKALQVRHVWQQPRSEPDDIDYHERTIGHGR
jgi:hypothetical protein